MAGDGLRPVNVTPPPAAAPAIAPRPGILISRPSAEPRGWKAGPPYAAWTAMPPGLEPRKTLAA
jgi:hypothetical protein